MEVIKRDGIFENVKKVGKYLGDELVKIQKYYPVMGDISGSIAQHSKY